MKIQSLPFGQKATISGAQQPIELVSDGQVDYFEESYYGQPNDLVDLRLDQGVREFQDPRLKKGLAAFTQEVSKTGEIRQKTANRLAGDLGSEWTAKVTKNSGWSDVAVTLRLGMPERVSSQEISYRSHGNKVNIRTFLPCRKLGVGSHGMSGTCHSDGSVDQVQESLSASRSE